MKILSEERIRRYENDFVGGIAIVYASLSIAGSVFKVSWMSSLTTDPRVLVPAIGSLIYFLVRRVVRLSDEIEKLRTTTFDLLFQPSIVNTHGSMWTRAESVKSRRIWATYLNPDAFKDGEVAQAIKEFYVKAESFEADDYRRVFAIYPDKHSYSDVRQKSIRWIGEHLKRSAHLKNYRARFVEMEFQAAEMWIDDAGINFSFPSARTSEAGWATTEPRALETAKEYFLQLWERARPVEELLATERFVSIEE